ncbi:nucleotidyltransferase family protein [Thermodesulfobacteriota bacterium]
MKAFLIAAGIGTRLKPYTEMIPKCLVPIQGKPLLEIWLELLDKYQIEAVLINIHHHAEKIDEFVAGIKKSVRVKITTFYEQNLLGSGGTVLANREFVADSDEFMIAYADNLTTVNLFKMICFHRIIRLKGGILTMGLIHSPNPKDCGIVVMDQENKIVKFIEKPQNPVGNLANSGIYIASKEIFELLPKPQSNDKNDAIDMGFDILPALIGKMYGYEIKEYLRDIGTIESYHKALEEWPQTDVARNNEY